MLEHEPVPPGLRQINMKLLPGPEARGFEVIEADNIRGWQMGKKGLWVQKSKRGREDEDEDEEDEDEEEEEEEGDKEKKECRVYDEYKEYSEWSECEEDEDFEEGKGYRVIQFITSATRVRYGT